MYDLTVVGGGPAGATCARLAAEAGLGLLHKSFKHTELIFQVAAEDQEMKAYLTDIVSRITTFSEVRNKIMKRMLTKHPLKAIKLGLNG